MLKYWVLLISFLLSRCKQKKLIYIFISTQTQFLIRMEIENFLKFIFVK